MNQPRIDSITDATRVLAGHALRRFHVNLDSLDVVDPKRLTGSFESPRHRVVPLAKLQINVVVFDRCEARSSKLQRPDVGTHSHNGNETHAADGRDKR